MAQIPLSMRIPLLDNSLLLQEKVDFLLRQQQLVMPEKVLLYLKRPHFRVTLDIPWNYSLFPLQPFDISKITVDLL
jgi:hypothetical protein